MGLTIGSGDTLSGIAAGSGKNNFRYSNYNIGEFINLITKQNNIKYSNNESARIPINFAYNESSEEKSRPVDELIVQKSKSQAKTGSDIAVITSSNPFANASKDNPNQIVISGDSSNIFYDAKIGAKFHISREQVIEAENKAKEEAKLLKASAPSPYKNIGGKNVLTREIVSLKDHKTFVYDDNGQLTHVFSNATGKKKSKTTPGLRQICGIEKFPYSVGKRRKASISMGKNTPYGPYVITNYEIDPKTSEKVRDLGEYFHGTNEPLRLGKNVSHGCIRHSNVDVFVLKNLVNIGDYIQIQ